MTAHRAYQGGVLTRRDYRDADRLLRSVGTPDAAVLRCWISDSKPAPAPDLLRHVLWGLAVVLLIVGAAVIA